MNLAAFHDWLFCSIVVAGSASACVMLCPAGLRVRLRRVVQVVPVVAFAVLIALGIGLVRPLPTLEVKTPEIVAQWAAAAGGWIAPWLVRIFAIVATLLLVRTLAGKFAIARLVRQSRPVQGRAWRKLLAECRRTLGMRGNVRLHFAGPGFIPSATGLFRRTVLLPDEAADWSHAQRRLVLLHELGHFRRGDLWTHALGQIACAVHWFNPFVWMLQRHLAVEREFACDALVVSRGAAPVDYATLLWKMGAAAQGPRFANAQSSRAPASASLAMAAPGRGKLEQRVRRILAPVREAGIWLRAMDSALCGGVALMLFACASFKPVIMPTFSGGAPWTADEISARLSADPFPGER
jgi:beta-lactamase regulating signal transducer with metallopeptidase domain